MEMDLNGIKMRTSIIHSLQNEMKRKKKKLNTPNACANFSQFLTDVPASSYSFLLFEYKYKVLWNMYLCFYLLNIFSFGFLICNHGFRDFLKIFEMKLSCYNALKKLIFFIYKFLAMIL